jgi:HAD superfamily hydrolase (TIGR01509 family)
LAKRVTAAFIFDVDGTMIDSMPFHMQSWEVFLARHGRGAPDAGFFRRTGGRTAREVMRELFGPLSGAKADALAHEKEALYRELFAAEFREIAGFTRFAHSARAAGVRMACATAGDPHNIAFALAGLGLEGFFDAAVGAHDVARGKPEPDLFLLAAERIGASPAECLVFEDAPLGIEGARRAGMRAVAITSSLGAEELGGAPHVIACASDFTGLVASALVRALQTPPN